MPYKNRHSCISPTGCYLVINKLCKIPLPAPYSGMARAITRVDTPVVRDMNMKLKTFLIITIIMAVIITGRRAATADAESYPVIAYAAPAERSLISTHATADRIVYCTKASLFSNPTSTVKTEEGLIGQWRERVFGSLAVSMTPDVRDGERMVARVAVKESMNLALQHLPGLERLIKVLKLEVSTDMLGRDEKKDEGDEALPSAASPVRRQAVKARFFMKTGLRIPVEQGKPRLQSETNAVYGSITSYFNVRLDGKLDSSLGLLYTLNRNMRVQVERTTADAVDPASGWAGRRSVSNTVKLVCVF